MLSAGFEVCCGGLVFEGDVCMIYVIIIVAFVLFVILRSLHFFMLNFICHLFAQFWSRRMSCWSECESGNVSIFRYNTLSSANSLILDVRLFSMSLMYRRNRSGPSTVPCGTPDVTTMCFLVGTIYEYLVRSVSQEGIYPVEGVVSDSIAI